MKFTAKHALTIVIISVLAIALLFFVWNEFQKEPINVTMYGAQVTLDGTVLTETEFTISGYRIPVRDTSLPLLYKACMNPISFSNTDVTLDPGETIYLNPVGYADDLHLCGFWLDYSPEKNSYVRASLFLNRDMTCCAIAKDGSYFIGSVDPDADLRDVLDLFLDLGLENF